MKKQANSFAGCLHFLLTCFCNRYYATLDYSTLAYMITTDVQSCEIVQVKLGFWIKQLDEGNLIHFSTPKSMENI